MVGKFHLRLHVFSFYAEEKFFLEEEIQKVASELPLMPGAEDTINGLKENEIDVAIISGSFDVVADKIKEKLGIDAVYTNSFTVEDGKLTGEVTGPLVSGSK